MKKEYYGNINILKFIFSICVVAIHTELLSAFGNNINWYGTNMILRLAVPFFFISSGIFYGNKIQKEKKIVETTKIYIKRLLYPLLFWLIINYPFWIIYDLPNQANGHTNNLLTIILYTIRAIIYYPWGALWYLLAIIVGIWICSKFYQKKMYYEPFFISIFLYLFGCIANSYHYIIENIPVLNKIIDTYMKIFISSRNGIFVGMLYISLGVILSKIIHEKKYFKIKTNILLLILSFCTLFLEVYILKHHTAYEDHSLFLIMPLLISFLVIILIQLPNHKKYKVFKDYSTGIYLTHRFVLNILTITIFNRFSNRIIVFITTLTISILLCHILLKTNNKFIKKIMLQ